MKPCLLSLLFAVAAFCLPLRSAEAPPNIVFIFTDDLGIADLGSYGRKDHRTPNLDRLARDGTRFTSAYCAQPICSPSRAALMTGRAPARLHLTTFLPGRANARSQKLLHPEIRMALPLEEKTLPELLKPAGYKTACVGKWHLGGRGFGPKEQGFDLYHPGRANTEPSTTEGSKGEYDLTRAAIEFIEANRQGPFFLFLSHHTPHIPFSGRPDLVEKNSAAFNPLYGALIETMDDSIGRVLKKIDELGLSENTIVVFTSDNGGLHVPELKHEVVTHNGPFRAGKGYLYEGGLRVPLIIRWPGKIPAGRTTDIPVNNTDWVPTFLALAGLEVPGNLDGQNIAGILKGAESAGDRQFFWHFPHYTNQGGKPGGALREGDWKLIERYEDGQLELYNLAEDIGETSNLAGRDPQRAIRMQKALDQWRKQIGAQANRPNPNFDPEEHAAIYHDFDSSRYDPRDTSAQTKERVLHWRQLMDAATRRQ